VCDRTHTSTQTVSATNELDTNTIDNTAHRIAFRSSGAVYGSVALAGVEQDLNVVAKWQNPNPIR
jgi:hypothetical protein